MRAEAEKSGDPDQRMGADILAVGQSLLEHPLQAPPKDLQPRSPDKTVADERVENRRIAGDPEGCDVSQIEAPISLHRSQTSVVAVGLFR